MAHSYRNNTTTPANHTLALHDALPILKEHAEAKEIVLEAYEEHDVVDTIMGEIDRTPVEDETWGAKFKVMKENLRSEEHTSELQSQSNIVCRLLLGKKNM